ncbi:MAG: hypothetical protein MUF54_13425 [Polyangiaceae bacterium]|jgi:hypothetical protein|nr:hypothetical protein [Polyangiaceae bacterium]
MTVPGSAFVSALLAITAGGMSACSSPPVKSATSVEDSVRRLAPVPACLTVLSSSSRPSGATTSLRAEYWQIVFPRFDPRTRSLPDDALACTGRPILSDAAFEGAKLQPGLDDARITLGGGADGIRAVWLRSHDAPDAASAGAVALVRVQGDAAYVIGVGAYRGRSATRLSIERLGNELLLLAFDNGCPGSPAIDPCSATETIYFVRQGRLVVATQLQLERVDFAVGSEPAATGRIRYHLTASPSFVGDALDVVEHVSVQDAGGREIRWAEVERRFLVVGDALEAVDAPLWSRVFRSTTAKR